MMEASEREVYRAAIHGDREAFEMIIRTQSRALFAIAYGILQNREEAEDAVQDALVKAWNPGIRNTPDYDNRSTFGFSTGVTTRASSRCYLASLLRGDGLRDD